MTRKRFVSCVVLCRNDREALDSYVVALAGILRGISSEYEIVLVHDGTVPGLGPTLDHILASTSYVRVLELTHAKGDHVGATAGLEVAIGDYVCVLDSDNDPPELLAEAVARAIDGTDVVLGIDANRSQRGVLGRVLGRLFVTYARRRLKVDVSQGMGSFRCMSRYAVNALIRLSQPHRYYRIWGDYVGLTTARMSYVGRGKRADRGLVKAVDEALDIVVSTSAHPLRMISVLAIAFAAANLVYIGYIVAIFLFKRDVATGWTTLSLQIALMTFFVITLLAIMSEYIGRGLERASPNPVYWVREERTSKRFVEVERRVNVVERSAAVDLDAPQR
jgi:dolichol-phosphate mannosyltransferase